MPSKNNVSVLKILGIAIPMHSYFNISLGFTTTQFSTGAYICPPGPLKTAYEYIELFQL